MKWLIVVSSVTFGEACLKYFFGMNWRLALSVSLVLVLGAMVIWGALTRPEEQ